MNVRFFVLGAFFLLFSCLVSGWDDWGYQYMGRRLCDWFDCGCEDTVAEAMLEPHHKFHDLPVHHCYNTSNKYPESVGYFKIPVQDDCPALDRTKIWMDDAETQAGCRKWYSLAVGFHYFLDAREIWGQVRDPDQNCVNEYHRMIKDYLLYSRGGWEDCVCGVCTSQKEVDSYVEEYAYMIREQVNAKHYSEPTVVVAANDIDWGNITESVEYIRENGVNVIRVKPQNFNKHRSSEYILILGGGNSAQKTGELVTKTLSEADLNRIYQSRMIGEKITKKNLWAANQQVVFLGGYEAKQTKDAFTSYREILMGEAKKLAQKKTTPPGCTRSEDCGTPYVGPLVCVNRDANPYRIEYVPHCRRGECVFKEKGRTTSQCSSTETCITGYGCLTESDAYPIYLPHRIPPVQSKLLTKARYTLFYDQTFTNYFKLESVENSSKITGNLTCQINTGEGWTTEKIMIANQTHSFNITESAPNTPGEKTYNYQIKCVNDSQKTQYAKNHSVIVNYIKYPLIYGFWVEPKEVSLQACAGVRWVQYTVQNHGLKNITCRLNIWNLTPIRLNVSTKGVNATSGGEFLYKQFNLTIRNTTYAPPMGGENFTCSRENISVRKTVYAANFTYIKPDWVKGGVNLYTNDCNITRWPFKIWCQNTDGISSTKKDEIKITYHPPST
ncbi:MAG: hypothetical protein GF334_09545 [Candidatus Altiarchaeales archaeon]|nr:hypothetical protein [Candidatus Altiarchaeales archaeon]